MRRALRNLGVVATRLAEFARSCEAEFDDAALFHAPGECYPLIRRAQLRRARRLRRLIRAETGLPPRLVAREFERRVSGR